jgi:hypothetical protein
MVRRRSVFLAVFILLLIVAADSLAQTAATPSGDGSAGNPYQIDSLQNLYWITQNAGSWGSYFVQTADIDASSDTSWNSGAGFPVIGTSSYSFSGQYDGGGHTISGLYISLSVSADVGLFSELYGQYTGSTVKNLGLINVNITGLGTVGGLAGRNDLGTIDNCYTTGKVHAVNGAVGGLVGAQVGGVLNNSHSSATVSGSTGNIGGLVGINNEVNPSMNTGASSITNCYATGNVSATGSPAQRVGGLVGTNEYSSQVSNCYATGNVTGTSMVGGLVGYNYYLASITGSYATGSVSAGGNWIGGFVGMNDTQCQISNSHCSGNVKAIGGALSGGFAGESYDLCTITNCYCTGVDSGADVAGGFVGEVLDGEIDACYSSGGVVGGSQVGGLVGTFYVDESVSGIGITNSYSFDSVTASGNYVGGLIGEVFGYGSVTICYSRGKVSASDTSTGIGGLIGYNPQYSSSYCFWDTVTSGQTTSASGDIPESTTAMNIQSTYTGWDFTNTWIMNSAVNDGYPYLRGTGDFALPVQATDFVATPHVNSVTLTWTTQTEVNNYGFGIERKAINGQLSAVGQTFSNPQWISVGFVKGAGASNTPHEYSFTDQELAPGPYSYRVKQVDRNGSFMYWKEIQVDVGAAPRMFSLSQNYPNPFNPTTTIEFTIPADGRVMLKVYDILGREVATLLDENRKAGEYQRVVFDASRFSSGVYFAVLQSGGKQLLKKMLLVK